MRFDIVLFDFGGTLDGPGDPWLERFARCYQACDANVSRAALCAAFGHSTRRSYADPDMRTRRLHDTVACHVAWQMEFLARDDRACTEAIVAAFVAQTRASLAASRALLERWRERARLGVISNFYGNVQLLLDEAGIAPVLTTIVDSAVVGVAKPDPRIFELALMGERVPADRALYVGDSLEKDVAGAHAAGIATAWLPGTEGIGTHAGEADFVLQRLEDVEALLA